MFGCKKLILIWMLLLNVAKGDDGRNMVSLYLIDDDGESSNKINKDDETSVMAARQVQNKLPPYWAREGTLHQDILAGTVEGSDYGIEYNARNPPRSDDDEKPAVKLGLNIFKMKEVNIATSQMALNVWLRLTWKDPRLAWNSTSEKYFGIHQTTFNAETDPELTDIWVPDLELVNQDVPLSQSLAPKQAVVYSDGTVFWSRVGMLNSICAFSGLKQHPFDLNECTVDFSGWARSGFFANYEFMDPPVSFGGTGTARTTYQEYQLRQSGIRTSIQVYTYPCCPDEPWPTLTYTFLFERVTTWLYMRTLVIPVVMLTFLSSAAFFFDLRCGERLGYGITVILAIIATEIIASESLPTCPEWLWIEAITSGSLAVSVMCLIESAVVTHIYYSQREEDVTEYIRIGDSKKKDDIKDDDPIKSDDNKNDNSNRATGKPSSSRKFITQPPLFEDDDLSWNTASNIMHNSSDGSIQRLKDLETAPSTSLEFEPDTTFESEPVNPFVPAPISGPSTKKWGSNKSIADVVQAAKKDTPPESEENPTPSPKATSIFESAALRMLQNVRRSKTTTPEPQSEEQRFKKWAAERNLNVESFFLVRQIDRFGFRVFIVLYPLFLLGMLASLPLWRDDYSINNGEDVTVW